jgi:hypothetical protein
MSQRKIVLLFIILLAEFLNTVTEEFVLLSVGERFMNFRIVDDQLNFGQRIDCDVNCTILVRHT